MKNALSSRFHERLLPSIRARLLVSFIAVILLTVGIIGYLAERAAQAEVERVQEEARTERFERLQDAIDRRSEDPEGLGAASQVISDLGGVMVSRVIVVDLAGVVVADSAGTHVGVRLERPPEGESAPVHNENGETVGVMINDPHPMPSVEGSEQPEEETSSSLMQADILPRLIWGSLGAVLLALILTILLSRRILSPAAAISSGARSLANRDFSYRIPVKSNDEFGDMARAFNSMADEISRTDQMRRDFVADAAHELRGPLTTIYGNLEALRDGVLQPTPGLIESLSQEASVLTRLVDDLQELALSDSGQLVIEMESCDLRSIARDTVAAFRRAAEDRGVLLSEVSTVEGAPVRGDERRLAQVAGNLVENAIRATDPGGRVSVDVRVDGQVALFEVADTGHGIPTEDQNRIFDRFYRVDKSRSRATGGSGLGLAIARNILEAHGATITVDSSVGQGSLFTITLPLDTFSRVQAPAEYSEYT